LMIDRSAVSLRWMDIQRHVRRHVVLK
jgi:hypothetical protein